jgi:hypothetical protein
MKSVIAGLTALLMLSSCEVIGWQDHRRPIDDESDLRVIVRVGLDWSLSGLTEDPVIGSVWFFPESGEAPHVLNTEELLDGIPLPPGDYRVLAFNGLLNYTASRNEQTSASFRNIAFRNTGSYDTFEAFCSTPLGLTTAFARPATDPSEPMAQPEILAADHYRNSETGDVLRLTMAMVDADIRPTLTFTPVPLIAQVQLKVHVENLVSASAIDGDNAATIGGMAGSVFLASGRTGATLVTHRFTINHRQYNEGSTVNGTLQGGCSTFGLPEPSARAADRENLLNLYFTLRDGTTLPPVERNITGYFTQEEQGEGVVQLTLRVEVGGESLGEDDLITLPDTQPPTGSNSGFEADVDDWPEKITLPIGL